MVKAQFAHLVVKAHRSRDDDGVESAGEDEFVGGVEAVFDAEFVGERGAGFGVGIGDGDDGGVGEGVEGAGVSGAAVESDDSDA